MVAGLTPVMPSATIYMMVGIELDKFPHISTAVEFTEKLMLEESIYTLPGEVSICQEQLMQLILLSFVLLLKWMAKNIIPVS